MSHFEWMKNLTHNSFGLMERRRRARRNRHSARADDRQAVSSRYARRISAPLQEIDLVRSPPLMRTSCTALWPASPNILEEQPEFGD